jgi:hypothetical protein
MDHFNLKLAGAILVAATAMASEANAGVIPYPNAGTENSVVYSFTATTTGEIDAYFYGADAGYTNVIGMLVNGVPTGIFGLNDHSSAHGDVLNLGSVTAGDQIVFELKILDPSGVGPWYSDLVMNSDGFHHIYATDFGGDMLIPAGTYIGFEDLQGGGDRDYNDEQFVITNVTTNVPEPSALAAMAAALASLLGLAFLRRRVMR